MNILSRFTAKAMKQNPSRTLVTLMGVILSAAMFAAVTTFTFSFWTFLVESEIARNGDYHVQCNWLKDEEVLSLRDNEDIIHMAEYKALGYLKTQEDSDGPLSTFVLAAGDDAYFASMPIHLSNGRLPQNSGELLLHEAILSELAYYGMETAVGGTISLELLRQIPAFSQVQGLNGATPSFRTEYTIVGHIAMDVMLSYTMDVYPMLTLADGEEGLTLWTRAYVKTAPRHVWELIQGKEFHDIEVNETLLAIYGQSRYKNFTTILLWLTVALCGIIVVGSVSLIYNSFSISLSERTKQFGLLSCIGATKKQLRRAVYAEALFLGLPGIPIGVLCGYGGITVTLWLLKDRLSLILGESTNYVSLHGVFSPLALAIGAVLALGTLLLSADLPAKRATAISPLEAIRQNRDYRIPKRGRKLRPSLFGLPGTLAKSYYRVSRGKYRATLISLTISLILFLSAAGFTTGLKTAADEAINIESFDFDCFMTREEARELEAQAFTARSAYTAQDYFLAQIREEQRSEEFLRYREDLGKFYPQAVDPVADILIYYLEDAVLEDYLLSKGMDPKEYLDPQVPKALVCHKEVITYFKEDENGFYTRYTYHYPPFAPTAQELILCPDGCPNSLTPFGEEALQTYGYTVDEEGRLILDIVPILHNEYGHITEAPEKALSYVVQWEEAQGRTTAAYYLIDETTGQAEEEPSCVAPLELRKVSIGKAVKELPFGIPQSAKEDPYYTALILPLSAASREVQENGMLCFNASDYAEARAWLQDRVENHYTDYRSDEEAARAMVLVVDIFSYGFIILICLICIANIFNTLSTNVALRRRDFGMLRSMGLRNKDLNRMLSYECLTYGGKALLWGLPLGLLANAGIQKLAADTATIAYVFPLKAVLSAVVSVFLIVFATMFYAASKLRKDNPIEAIRQECI